MQKEQKNVQSIDKEKGVKLMAEILAELQEIYRLNIGLNIEVSEIAQILDKVSWDFLDMDLSCKENILFVKKSLIQFIMKFIYFLQFFINYQLYNYINFFIIQICKLKNLWNFYHFIIITNLI
ncbi:hypothetical protein PPERSA_12598 [Pseudocohnilembus persalinus]|uniref:Uncharacterized protein n=1 Tax=Pseudocohnilembus persalinus TaxID=266149 RepID=A0A0V0QCK7_PSEPJ|nr:hypothetical protein PPERSA_12598 [Pseudocohnilembus persalinus]|eukprot:KRW99922.1 hypothetical protein PPERSA_12598 [Pseudocohnilembus persalinus]